jgi:hypothetical protein
VKLPPCFGGPKGKFQQQFDSRHIRLEFSS